MAETRYAKSGSVHIAYRVEGRGAHDVVLVPGLTSNLDAPFEPAGELEDLRELARFARCIAFDKRGTGISDSVVGAPSLEERMDDVRAVMDAVGSTHASLCARGADGCSMSVLFAATYPERTVALVLTNPRPRFTRAPDYPWGPTREEYDRQTQDQIRTWGSLEHARSLAQRIGLATDEATLAGLARRMRLAASPGAAQSLSEANAQIDVRHVLGSVHVPSLIIHAPDRADVARYVADKLPYAEVVEEDEAKFERIEEFLGKAHEDWNLRGPEPARVLATVLFTDLVASTSRAVELGPGWRELLRQHNAVIRRELARHAGREIDRAGDGFFASGFDGPARAIRCACAIRDAVRGLGLGVRLGVHTGECDLVDGKLAGLGVVIGSRVAAEARDGEVLVSGTVKDLVAGSGIEFEPRGAHELKGLGDWPLYAVVAT